LFPVLLLKYRPREDSWALIEELFWKPRFWEQLPRFRSHGALRRKRPAAGCLVRIPGALLQSSIPDASSQVFISRSLSGKWSNVA
jgi:hypothetical protein